MKKFLSAIAILLCIVVAADAKDYGRSNKTSSSSSNKSSSSSPKPSKPSRSYTPSAPPKSDNKPSKPSRSYDSGARSDARQESSKRSANSSNRDNSSESYSPPKPPPPPKPKTFRTASGQEREIKPDDPYANRIRSNYGYDRWSTRNDRSRRYYGDRYDTYRSQPAPSFNDGMSPLFWYFLLDQATEDRAQYVYHHKDEMDPARYQELLKRDAATQARVAQLEAEAKARDPNYVPKGIDPDLQYTDEYVKTVAPGSTWSLWAAIKWFFKWVFRLVIFAGVVYVALTVVRGTVRWAKQK